MFQDGLQKLTANSVHKIFLQGKKEVHVLREISTEFEQGKTYAIIGASGTGKSTFLHILGGIDKPSSGNILLNNIDIYTLKTNVKEQLLNQKFGFVFQFHYLIKEFTVLENIITVGLIKGDSHKKSTKRAEELLDALCLQDTKNSYPGQLSGGQQQRVSIARAIFNKPTFLFADEPTGNLDEQNSKVVVDMLLNARDIWGMGVIMCSHNPNVYQRMEQVLELHDGVVTINQDKL